MFSHIRENFKQTRKSLFWQIAYAFMVLTIISAFAYGFVLHNAQLRFQELRDQTLGWDIAEELKRELQPLLRKPQDREAIESAIGYLQLVNPAANIFVLDKKGLFLFPSFIFPEKSVDKVSTEKLERFLNHQGLLETPLYAENPYNRRGEFQNVIFSVAKVAIGKSWGYLYVSFRSPRYAAAHRMHGELLVGWWGLVIYLAVMAATLVLGTLVFFRLTKRFHRMTGIITDFTEGNYSKRISDETSDEIGIHGRAFDTLADTIVANIDQLESRDELRRELVGTISHELKRPLAVMQTIVETVSSDTVSLEEEQRRKYMNKLLDSFAEMNQLTNDLFELSSLDAKERQPKIEKFLIQDLLKELR